MTNEYVLFTIEQGHNVCFKYVELSMIENTETKIKLRLFFLFVNDTFLHYN